jgi:glycosyltransferase involved in cell wall biosynthesis
MNTPLVSVVIPAYNQANYLGEAIQSVLDQTYDRFEIVVVDDDSPDQTREVVTVFDDPRIRYIKHEKNRGLPATRNTGIRATSGEIIALLDADDFFHPEKLQAHVAFLDALPEIGVTYNARFDLNHSAKTIRGLWRPPLFADLADFVLGFPFSPSDMVLRREWVFQAGLFDETLVNGGEDSDFPCRLALAGCKFASVDRALNYRRYHSGRIRKRLEHRAAEYIDVLNNTFADPRCPDEVRALREKAYASRYLEVAWYALAQGETILGRDCVRKIVQLEPAAVEGQPCALVKSLLTYSIVDESRDHGTLMQGIFNQLPEELTRLSEQHSWAVAHGYLLRGTQAVMWGRLDDGQHHFARASDLAAEIEESYLRMLVAQLLDYEKEFGTEATEEVVQALVPYLKSIGGQSSVRWLKGCYLINCGFRSYQRGERDKVPQTIIRAIANDPTYLTDRGAMAVLFRSLMNR